MPFLQVGKQAIRNKQCFITMLCVLIHHVPLESLLDAFIFEYFPLNLTFCAVSLNLLLQDHTTEFVGQCADCFEEYKNKMCLYG